MPKKHMDSPLSKDLAAKLTGVGIDDIKPMQLFKDRLIAEGRYDGYHDRERELHTENLARVERGEKKIGWAIHRKTLMDEFGYLGEEQERELAKERVVDKAREDTRKKNTDKVNRWRRGKKWEEFMSAIEHLSPTCSAMAELEWIASHPLMIEATVVDREDEKFDPKRLHVRAEHVDENCPSKAAVGSLANWLKNPAKFYEHRLSEQKKEITKASSREEEANEEKLRVMDNMQDLEALLEEELSSAC